MLQEDMPQLMNALPEDDADGADFGKIATIYENALILDVWTDGMISRALDTDITIPQCWICSFQRLRRLSPKKKNPLILKRLRNHTKIQGIGSIRFY